MTLCAGGGLLIRPGLRAGEGVAAGSLAGVELHVLDADAVGVVLVELDFAVAAHLFGGLAARGEAALLELGDDGVHVGDAEGEVIVDADLVLARGGRGVEHVLDPVGAVGDLHGNKINDTVFHAAGPVEMEAEDVFVKAVFSRGGADDEAGVDDAAGDAAGHVVGMNIGAGRVLEELDDISLWVFHAEVLFAVTHFGDGSGDSDAFAFEIKAEGFGVGGGPGDVVEGELSRRACGVDDDGLARVAVEAEAAGVLGGGNGCPAEEVGVEGAIGFKALRGERDMGDAGDGGTLGCALRERRDRGEKQRCGGEDLADGSGHRVLAENVGSLPQRSRLGIADGRLVARERANLHGNGPHRALEHFHSDRDRAELCAMQLFPTETLR